MRRFWLVPFGAAAIVTSSIVWLGPTNRLWMAWLVAVNGVALVTFVFDKWIAGTDRTRVPETALVALAAAGGWPLGWVAMRVARHKTGAESRRFRMGFWFAAVLNVALIVGVVARRR